MVWVKFKERLINDPYKGFMGALIDYGYYCSNCHRYGYKNEAAHKRACPGCREECTDVYNAPMQELEPGYYDGFTKHVILKGEDYI